MTGGRRLAVRAPRGAIALHVATLAGAFGFWAYLGRHLWFFDDEWQFLLGRGLWYAPGNPHSIWSPHFGHWSTLPVLWWRALFNVFHLSSYWPYLWSLLAAVVVVMHLLWRVCLRNGADPWVSAAAVATLGVLGPGAEDLGWAFQLGFVGSLGFGLGALLLADHPAAGRRQLALASAATLASLMCSAVGVGMAAALAVLLFARLPPAKALAVLALPTASFAIWWAFVGRLGPAGGAGIGSSALSGLPSYVWTGLSTALGRSFNLPSAGATLLVALGAGLAWRSRAMLQERAAIAGLCAAALVFYLLAGLGRGTLGDAGSTAPRYIFVAMALLLPAIARILSPRAAPRLRGDVRQGLTALAVVALLATALGDAGQAETWASGRTSLVAGLKTEVVATSRLLGAGAPAVVGAGVAPIGYSPDLSVAVLRHLGRSGLLGHATVPPAATTTARALISVSVTARPLFSGRFHLVAASGVATWPGPGPGRCTSFAPQSLAVVARLVMRPSPPNTPSSVQAVLAPAAASASAIAAVPAAGLGETLLSRAPGVASAAVPLDLPPGESGYVDDDYPSADLVLQWGTGTVLSLCGLAR